MTSTSMNLVDDLRFRGLIKQTTDDSFLPRLNTPGLTFYAGYDPTSDSLHIGSLLPLLTQRRFQIAGHKPIVVLGGATGMIGDPSGKTQERSLMTRELMESNLDGIRPIFERLLDFSGKNSAKITNNLDWFEKFSAIEFLRDIGKHFTINHMVAKESVRSRFEDREHGISYTEFSYMLLQALDFYHLHQELGCTVQIGGSDQWGNITAGVELIRRKLAERDPASKAESNAGQVFGMTMPLIMKSDGSKFGKSEKGNVWLSAKKTSPFQFYQYLIQVADADVDTLLKFLTFLSHDEILHLAQVTQTSPEKREAQKKLAQSLTTLIHGESETQRVEVASAALFSSAIRDLDATTLQELLADAPSLEKPRSMVLDHSLIELFVETNLCPSKGQARKDLQAGGLYLNNERVEAKTPQGDALIEEKNLLCGRFLVLRKGKKNYALIKLI